MWISSPAPPEAETMRGSPSATASSTVFGELSMSDGITATQHRERR